MKLSPIIILICLALLLGGCQGAQQNTSTNENQNVIISASKETTAVEGTEISDNSTVCEETQTITENAKAEQNSESRETTATEVIEKAEKTVQQDKNENKADNNYTKPSQKPKKEATIPKETQAPMTNPTLPTKPKPTQPATKPKPTESAKEKVNEAQALGNGIAYGQALGFVYDSSLSVGNASWFPPTQVSDYPTTDKLSVACYAKVDYLLTYWSEQGYAPSDFTFNLVIYNGDLYLLYS